MNAQTMYYDVFMDVRSPYTTDKVRVVNRDEDGNEFITFETFDAPKYQQSLGLADSWKLKNLLRSGVDPDFPIHTGYGTRLEGVQTLEDFIVKADAIANEESNVVNVE